MKPIKSLILVSSLALFILSGCQTTEINTEVAPDANLAAYETYAVLPIPDKIPGVDSGVILRIRDTVMNAVEKEMNAKGYLMAPVGEADIAVNISGQVVPKVDIANWGFTDVTHYGWVHGYPYGTDISVDQYEEGTLIIEIYDRPSKKLVWVGWGKTRRSERGPDPKRIQETVFQIMESYPDATK
jgi:hypothetical protein